MSLSPPSPAPSPAGRLEPRGCHLDVSLPRCRGPAPPRSVLGAMPFRKGRGFPGSPQVRRPLSPRGFRLASSHPALAILPRVTPLRSALSPPALRCPLEPRRVRGCTTWMREPPLGWEAESAVLVEVLLANPRILRRPSPGKQAEQPAGNFSVCFWETWVIVMVGARQPGADRRETAEGRPRRVQGRSQASSAFALSPWGSHFFFFFYPALSVSSAAKWAQEESRLWEDRQTSIKKQTGAPLRSVWQQHAVPV